MVARSVIIIGSILLCLTGTAISQTASTNAQTSPVFTGIVVDCTGTQRLQMDRVVGLIKNYVESMQEGDEAFVVRYVDAGKISVAQDMTKEKSDLDDAAEGLYVEAGQTAMLEAVNRAAKYLAENSPAESSRVLLLVGSGEDRGSVKSIDDAVSTLKEQKVRVFAIAISDLKVSTKLLDRLTRDTGGRTITPRTVAELSNAVVDMIRSIRGEPASR
jgi:hypothetical protein